MVRPVAHAALFFLIPAGISAQSSDAPAKFEASDIHPAAKSNIPFSRTFSPRNGRYELTNASIVDLINFAYGMDPDKILGGPSWVEMDRFDVIAKEPAGTTYEMRMPMLQALLAERFGLVVRQETRPVPAYALTAGKSPRLKPAAGSEEAGCRLVPATGQPVQGGNRITFGRNGVTTTVDLGPGMTIPYQCRNITMAAFVEGLPRMFGAQFGSKRVVDETGLKGAWNFDLKWSMNMFGGPPSDGPDQHVSIFEALEKQVGLKLEERQLPAAVIVIEKVNRTPTPNDPDVSQKLPAAPAPTEFEVADIKPSAPGGRGGGIRMTPGGRMTADVPLRNLVMRAFNGFGNDVEIVGLPVWANTTRFSVTAKAPDGYAVSMDTLPPMLRSLLVDRFGMKYHSEKRELQAYSLVSAKPKMKKADPESRAYCKEQNDSPSAPSGTRTLVCQNVTMAQFADRLQNFDLQVRWPVLDETGLEGTWDFSLSYSPIAGFGPGRGPGAGAGDAAPVASDPTGGITIFDAVQKQLGLKLDSRKRPEPVIVIDHIEPQPTEN